jgi:hypothetical protein
LFFSTNIFFIQIGCELTTFILRMLEARPIVFLRSMALRGQSFALWSVLAGLVLGGCAGRVGDGGPGPSGNGGSGTPGVAGATGNGGASGPGAGGSGNSTGLGGSGNSTGLGGSGSTTGTGGTGIPGGSTLLPASIRRLTNAEYDASVQSLLGTTQSPSHTFPTDTRQGGGFTLNDAQRIDPLLARALDDAALALVTEARGNGRLANLSPCTNATTQGETCATTFISSFGAKAYRRSLTAEESASLLTLYRAGATGGTYNEGIDLVTRGILQSAGFMYATHLGTGSTSPVTLTQNEMASALSFLTTAAPPDATLLTMASSGGLASADARETQVRRLLDSPAGRTRMVRIVREWLGIDEVSQIGKDTNVYSQFTSAVRTAYDTESVNFVNEVVQNSTGTVQELLSANWSVYDSNLNAVYGTNSAGTTARTTLPRRVGILNQGAFLSRFAHAQESAPVLRGVAIMRRLACLNLPDPTSLNIVVVPPMPDATKSTRERFSVHATDAACANCHSTIDSIGFAFELFNGMGKQRAAGTTSGTLRDDNGANTTSSTTLVSHPLYPIDFAGTYADSNALSMALANSAQVRECVARHMFRSAAGRSEDTVRNAESAFINIWNQLPSDSRGKFKEVLVAYVRSPQFEQRSLP